MITGQYSVPYTLMGSKVMVRQDRINNQILITARDGDGITRHVTSHALGARGEIIIDDAHFPPNTPSGPQQRVIIPKSAVEKHFLAIGAGAHAYIRPAAADGTPRLKERLPLLTALTAAWPAHQVSDALATATAVGRFLVADVESILQRAPSRWPNPGPGWKTRVWPKALPVGTNWERWPNPVSIPTNHATLDPGLYEAMKALSMLHTRRQAAELLETARVQR